MMTPFVKRAKQIISRKKITSRESTIPVLNGWKWVITLKEETKSTSHGLSIRISKLVTGGKPHNTRNRQITTEMIKLTTWLRVIAEVMQLMARYVPAIGNCQRTQPQ